MEAVKQAEETVKKAEDTAKSWTDTQAKIFERWFETFQGAAAPKAVQGFDQIRKVTLESWEASVKSSLQTQAELSKITIDTLAAWAPAPEKGVDGAYVKQLRDLVNSWTEAQAQGWSALFDVAKNVDMSPMAQTWDKLMETFQQSTQRAWKNPAQWFTPANYSTGFTNSKTTSTAK